MRVPFIAHEFSFSFVRWQLCKFFFQMLHCVTLMAALGWPLTWVFILNYITASERWAYLSVTWCTWSSMSSTVCTVYISIWLCEISKYWRCCPWEGSRQKKKHVATCGWLGTAQVNSLGCVPGRGILLFIYGHKWGHVFGWSSESLTFMMVLDRRVSGSTLGFQSHLVTLCKPFRRHFQLMHCE